MTRVQVKISVCNGTGQDGWEIHGGLAKPEDIAACLSLPKERDRAEFWSRALGFKIRHGRALIWEIQEPKIKVPA